MSAYGSSHVVNNHAAGSQPGGMYNGMGPVNSQTTRADDRGILLSNSGVSHSALVNSGNAAIRGHHHGGLKLNSNGVPGQAAASGGG